MGSGISLKELVWCSGCGLFLWVLTLSASRRLIVCHLLSVRRGFFLLASLRNPARDQFLYKLHSRIDPSIPTVLCGDFNEVFDRSLNRAGGGLSTSSRDSSSSLKYLFEDCCVIDIWRYLHPSSSGFTWTRSDGSLASRIDRGCLPFLPVISSLVLFRTIVVCVSRFRSPMLSPLVRAFGSSTLLFLMTLSMLP